MAEIELVIKIDEDYYEIIKHGVEDGSEYKPWTLIAHGTPLKTGHWIEREHNGILFFECSKCSYWFLGAHLSKNNYCPSCGCRMVEPQEKTGHWIDHQEDRWIYAQCLECGTVHDTRTNYCPNCGAKMKSEVRNEMSVLPVL